MQSKTSYFNRMLFRKNLTRFWPLWVGASLAGALAPMTLLVALLQHRGYYYFSDDIWGLRHMYYGVLAWGVPVISLLYAILCAMAVWNYLFNARSVGAMHTLPITRKGLFITNFLSGMAMMLIPYVITGGLIILVTLAFGLLDLVGVLVTVLGVLGLSLFYFATATLVAFITGNAFAMPALYFIFHFLAVAMEWLISALMSQFYFGVSLAYEAHAAFLSPTIYLLEKLCAVSTGEEVLQDGIYRWETTAVNLENGWLIAVYALAGAVLLGCAYLLYQRRRSECAGDVVAVGWMKPIFRYGVAMCSALALGIALYSILWDSFQTRETVDLLPMTLCMIAGGIIGFYIASMLLAKSLRVFRSTWKGAAATVAAAAALCLVVGLDPAGVERWIPQADQVESIHLYMHTGISGGSVSGRIQDPEAIARILSLHQEIITERDTLSLRDYWADENHDWAWVRLEYFLPNGKVVFRSYDINYLIEDLRRQDSAVEQLSRLACDPVIQTANIFSGVGENAQLTGGYLNNVYNTELKNFETVNLSLEELQALEAAIRRDIALGNFGRTYFPTDGILYDDVAYRFSIRLYYVDADPLNKSSAGPAAGTADTHISISLSTYCTETMKVLESIESLQDPLLLLTYQEYYDLMELEQDKIGEDYYYYDDYYDGYLYDTEVF